MTLVRIGEKRDGAEMAELEKAIEDFESPGELLGDIPVRFSNRSLPVGLQSVEEMEYVRAGEPDLVVVGARPSHGKSAFLCQMAYNLARHGNVQLFSLEMSKQQLKGRLLAVDSETPLRELRDRPDLADSANKNLATSKLFIDDTNGLDINTLVSRSIARHRRKPLMAVFVDYLQIVSTPTTRSKAEEVDLISRKLKELALELKCPVIVAAQLNRNIEGRFASAKKKEDVFPVMSDLADSSGIEKWADVVMFLHRKYVNGIQSTSHVGGYVAKNRHGQIKDFNLQYRGEILKFYDRGFSTDGI